MNSVSGRRERVVESGGVRLAVREEGDPSAPTVLLVHGFPDNSSLWDGVAERLRDRFHVVRYDVRGTGRSDRPEGREAYRLDRLAADVVSVTRAVSPDRPVHLVGHDWGSIQAWEAVTEPEHQHLFASYTSISGPCLDHLGHWLRDRLRRPGGRADALRQGLRSWYVYAMHVPVLPELAWRHVLGPAWARALGRRGAAGTETLTEDALHGVELYRANILERLRAPRERRTSVPVQLLVPERDPFVSPAALDDVPRWCDRVWRRDLPAGHWVPRSRPEVVARAVTELIDHLEGEDMARELVRARVGAGRRGRFAGRLVVITGAGSGIGRATALAAAEAGADVVAWDIDGAAAERTAEQAHERGVRAWASRVDVTDPEAVRAAAAEVRAEGGVPDVVMANAGIGVMGFFAATDEHVWRRVVDVNLLGVVHTLQAFLPALIERGQGGHLVITSSMAAYAPAPGNLTYTAAKAGVLALGRGLREELAEHGIDVSVVCPGMISTNFVQGMTLFGLSGERHDRARTTNERLIAKGRPPAVVARAVLRAVERRRFLVPVNPEAKFAYVMSRVAPAALSRLLRVFIRRTMPDLVTSGRPQPGHRAEEVRPRS
ncbi:Short-chain dehydrogenase [Streptoalloteichus tenebrarius]|uniref:Short-chain dehydrogenase n=1 Tax=Streptoalloteichus tenebrarius (strain ATCC 17920 / DSM 40477 / JCM 4838 / CBS 697.72 / NBRC 16177 / NCIMB 11028 / NRRL B-12390 / A12253. 1 / ISP 5477) TaxID=1933 RepID=A0ABT1HXP5_STRSD|nr:SDR family oxidoreductase [Streptoalloteichus tenebrarius]MCP2260271.1 Short-chain dehydrogenase [Streptoalloteichus tenebrarius]BFF03021.1 SDR family oxidoreductase [Streptoalloteichus tenebrarius]